MQQREEKDAEEATPFTFSTKDETPHKAHKDLEGYRESDSPVRFIDAQEYQKEQNALEETWGAGDHDTYTKTKKKKDKKSKYRDLEQWELDREDEESRRKAYEAELTREEDAKREREDLKKKETE